MKGIWSFSEETIVFEILELLYQKLDGKIPSYAKILLEAQENVNSRMHFPGQYRMKSGKK